MLDLRIIASGVALSPFDLPAMLGRAEAARELGDTIEGLIAYLDALGGDIDLEDGGDLEADNSDREPDEDGMGDIAWTEWHTRGRHKQARCGEELMARDRYENICREDDEDDDPDTGAEDDPRGFDPEEDYCTAGDDGGGIRFMGFGPTWGSPDEDSGIVPEYGIDQRDLPQLVTIRNADGHLVLVIGEAL